MSSLSTSPDIPKSLAKAMSSFVPVVALAALLTGCADPGTHVVDREDQVYTTGSHLPHRDRGAQEDQRTIDPTVYAQQRQASPASLPSTMGSK